MTRPPIQRDLHATSQRVRLPELQVGWSKATGNTKRLRTRAVEDEPAEPHRDPVLGLQAGPPLLRGKEAKLKVMQALWP